MGKPSPWWNIQVHDDNGLPVRDGEEGRPAVSFNPRPHGLFVEYIDNTEENKKTFVNGWYYTGDKVQRDAGGYFWFVGRDDDVIKAPGIVSDILKLKAPSLNIQQCEKRQLWDLRSESGG